MLVLLFLTSTFLGLASAGQGICYPKYGCFHDNPPFNRPLVPLPHPPDRVGTNFRLFTRSNPLISNVIDDSDVSKLQASRYDGKKRTIIIVHGFIEHGSVPWMNRIRHALIKQEDANVITTDWSRGATIPYEQATANTRMVGAQITELIKFLNNQTGNTPASFYLVGFSLGAHISGYVGRRIAKTGQKLNRITGLDPASIHFVNAHVDVRLDPSDADFVDVMHTDMDLAGTPTVSGHIDFYPNGGKKQPGCRDLLDGPINYVICDHMRAPEYYAESVTTTCPMLAFPCTSMDDFERGYCFDCENRPCPSVGYNAGKRKGVATGKHFSLTNADKPFCVHHYRISFKTGHSWWAGHADAIHVTLYGKNGNSGVIRFKSRNIYKGTKEMFVAPVTKDLGTLTKIDVRHNGIPVISKWFLEKVLIQPENTERKYTGCFNSWLNSAGGIRALQQGDNSC
ncbi:inactive pancreatic lipase-related protein 1 isoform X2 [Nematostella vectensis]|nr:inactive pancreatic lipase-related protein 1 isoform X2 [Nematostella vectensis]XP_048582761.1 inactive pancreatic lipase-related protein 1 isoform X2 [Nematostella vectensis]